MKSNVILSILIGLNTITISADTLKDIVSSVLDTNPIVNERYRNYEATKADIRIEEAGYYPTLDLKSSSGRKTTGRLDSNTTNETFNVFQNSLVLRQNIFSGFSTNEKVKYQEMRALSASYSYLSKANDVALQVVNVYINLQREKALLSNSNLNVEHNDITYNKVKKAHHAGLSTFSEVSKIHSSLSLAKSNVVFQDNKRINANHRFNRVVGNGVDPESLASIPPVLTMPDSLEDAKIYALKYSPAILVGEYNIKGAKALHHESKSAYYPKVDLELSQNYNENYNEFIGTDDRSQGLVVFSYNLYNGGADEAKKVKTLHKLHQEVSVSDDLKREVALNVELSWSSYELALGQMPFLEQYQSQSKKTLTLYSSEYQLGKRSLLDLISAENDLKRANDELIYAKYGLLQAKYSIMHAMGLIMVSIMGNEEAYYQRVGVTSETKSSLIQEEANYADLEYAMQKDTSSQEHTTHSEPSTNKERIPNIKSTPVPTQEVSQTATYDLDEVVHSLTKVRWESR